MPTRSRSESDHDADSQSTTARAEMSAGIDGGDGGQGIRAAGGFRLPVPGIGEVDPLRLLWLGGLAALATIEIIEWPVALALGAGSFVAERLARQEAQKHA
jgi:hypothetical protein